ncbi:unnamed protein product [Penicillium glandicola]
MAFEVKSLESLGSLIPRDSTTCTTGKLWYVCTAGNFRGCCASDPCTTGICPADDDDDDSSTTDSSTTSTKSSTLSLTATAYIEEHGYFFYVHFVRINYRLVNGFVHNDICAFYDSLLYRFRNINRSEIPTVPETAPVSETFTSPVKLTTSEVSTGSDTSTGTETTGVTELSSVLGASVSPSSTASNTPSAASSNLGAIIGGVVGGIAVLVICAILLFFCCRRKRKYGKREKGSSSLVSWYAHGFRRKHRSTASEMKGPLSPPDSKTNNSRSAVSPFTAANTQASIILTPDLALGSSSTSLISHSPHKTPPIPPASNELFASVPARQGFTPELQDTGFQRLRAELASHSQSELINVPMEQRQYKSRTTPRAWESAALAPIASPHASAGRRTDNGHSHSNSNGSPPRNQGRVITAEGVVLGANLDRYSNGLEIGESLARGERGRKTERGETDHVMSFMQYSGRPVDRSLGDRPGIVTTDHTSISPGLGHSASRSRPGTAERGLEDVIVAAEGNVDVPPAYEVEEGAQGQDIKSPSGRMEMSPRGV